MQPHADASSPMAGEDRELDELEVATDPAVGDTAGQCGNDEVRPVLPAFADVTPSESDEPAVVVGDAQAETLPGAMSVIHVGAPVGRVWLVAEDRVVHLVDLGGVFAGALRTPKVDRDHATTDPPRAATASCRRTARRPSSR